MTVHALRSEGHVHVASSPILVLGSRPTSSTGIFDAGVRLDTETTGLGLWARPCAARSQRRTAVLSRHGRLRGMDAAFTLALPALPAQPDTCRLQLVVAEPTPVRGVLADRKRRPRRRDVDVVACDSYWHAAHEGIDLVVAAMGHDDVRRGTTRLDPRECERLAVPVTADEVEPRITQPSLLEPSERAPTPRFDGRHAVAGSLAGVRGPSARSEIRDGCAAHVRALDDEPSRSGWTSRDTSRPHCRLRRRLSGRRGRGSSPSAPPRRPARLAADAHGIRR